MRPDSADDSPYAMSATVVLTIADNNGASTDFTMDSGDQIVSFNVEIIDPCVSTAIKDITFDPSSLEVVDGLTGTTTWNAPITDLDEALTDTLLCGTMSFEVYLDTDDSAFTPTYAA